MLASKYTDFEFSYSKRGGETRATAELAIYRQHARGHVRLRGGPSHARFPGERKKRQWGEDPDAEDARASSLEAELDRALGQGRSTSLRWRPVPQPAHHRDASGPGGSGRSGSGGRCSPGLTWGGAGLGAC